MRTANATIQANAGSFPITLNLTLDQLKSAYSQLLSFRKIKPSTEKDWMEEPEMMEMIEDEVSKAEEDYAKGEYLTLSQLKESL